MKYYSKWEVKDSDTCNYCYTVPDTLCHALIECPKSAFLWKDAEKWLRNITGKYIKIADNEKIFVVHDDIPKKKFVTNMLIVCTQLFIHKKRKKGENVYFGCMLHLMYKEYKAD